MIEGPVGTQTYTGGSVWKIISDADALSLPDLPRGEGAGDGPRDL